MSLATSHEEEEEERKVYSNLTQEVEGLFVANTAKEEEK